MNKIIFLILTLSVLSYLKMRVEPHQVISPSKAAQSQEIMKPARQIVKLDVKPVEIQLSKIEMNLKQNQFKNYNDFSDAELQKYNHQVRESVKIKKLLFLKKYAHWSNI